MKIISGTLKGRKINEYNTEGVRPTQDRVKESLFAIIQSYVKDSCFLDLFAGSGSIGIEAISNGCKKAYFTDKSKICIGNINKIIYNFNITEKAILINDNYIESLSYFKKNDIKFDLIFLDPPYKMIVCNDIIKYLIENNIINDNGLIICETDKEYINEYNDFMIWKNKKYGSTYITILKKD